MGAEDVGLAQGDRGRGGAGGCRHPWREMPGHGGWEERAHGGHRVRRA